MPDTIELYVKSTSNSRGMALRMFRLIGPIYRADSIRVKATPNGAWRRAVGWTDIRFGSRCPVHVAVVELESGQGILAWGGNSGVRVLDPTAPRRFHLPSGRGYNILLLDEWQLEDMVLRAVGIIRSRLV